MNKELTKEDLINWGISVELTDESVIVKRNWTKNNSKVYKTEYQVKITSALQEHPLSGKTKEYPVIVFSYKSKTVSLPIARVVYAWFINPIPKNMDVDHIDNNPFNNRPNNLRLLTRKQNVARRVSKNQYTAHLTDEEVLELRRIKTNLYKAKKLLKQAKKEKNTWAIALEKQLIKEDTEEYEKLLTKNN